MTLELRSWWQDDPARLDLELEDVSSVAPDLIWSDVGPGSFEGELPVWPFDRPIPEGLEKLVPTVPKVRVAYTHAFPAAPPYVFSLDPLPHPGLRGWTAFHVLPNGALCLLRDADQWTARDRTSELLLKAAGWQVEYALFRAGAIDSLTESGIVSDAKLDELVQEVAATL